MSQQVVVCFSGHMTDQPDRRSPRFPARIESAVHGLLARQLEDAGATIGFSSAAAGSDILFLEAMLARGGEVHIVLPFSVEEFRRISVECRPGDWTSRYDGVLARATSVSICSPEPAAGSAEEFERCNQTLMRMAREAPGRLVPMVVWDGRPGDGGGGTASFVEAWRKLGVPVSVIDVALLVDQGSSTTLVASRLSKRS